MVSIKPKKIAVAKAKAAKKPAKRYLVVKATDPKFMLSDSYMRPLDASADAVVYSTAVRKLVQAAARDSDKGADLLKRAGIIDAKGKLAARYRD